MALTPGDAGFASYVKLWKPFFVGKHAYIAREQKRDAVITRFRLDNKGVKPPQNGDPVVDRRGRVIGVVTSCSIDSEGFQTGQAHLKTDFTEEGTPIFIFSGASHAKDSKPAKPLSDLKVGDKAIVPDAATVLSRFPVKKKIILSKKNLLESRNIIITKNIKSLKTLLQRKNGHLLKPPNWLLRKSFRKSL